MAPIFLSLLVEAYEAWGESREGLGVLDEALATIDHTGERWWEAELYRLKGQLLLRHVIPDEHRRKPVFSRPLRCPAANRPSLWNFARL